MDFVLLSGGLITLTEKCRRQESLGLIKKYLQPDLITRMTHRPWEWRMDRQCIEKMFTQVCKASESEVAIFRLSLPSLSLFFSSSSLILPGFLLSLTNNRKAAGSSTQCHKTSRRGGTVINVCARLKHECESENEKPHVNQHTAKRKRKTRHWVLRSRLRYTSLWIFQLQLHELIPQKSKMGFYIIAHVLCSLSVIWEHDKGHWQRRERVIHT